MNAIEIMGTVDTDNQLILDGSLPIIGPTRVRVIVLVENQDEIAEATWLKSTTTNPIFDFLKDERENIYSIADGKPFHG